MGLDYMIYKRNKQTGEESELAYGPYDFIKRLLLSN